MTTLISGTSGITYPNSTTTPAASINAKFSPWITYASSAITLTNSVSVHGTTGLIVNGKSYTTA